MWHIRFRTESGARYLLRVHPQGSGNAYLTRQSGPALPWLPFDLLVNRVLGPSEWEAPVLGQRFEVGDLGSTTPVVGIVWVEYPMWGPAHTERFGDRALVV